MKRCLRPTGVHVCSVRQRLGLPPITDGFLLLLLQDEPAQVGLDLGQNSMTCLGSTDGQFFVLFFSRWFHTNLFQFLLLQRLGLVRQVFKLVLLLQPLLLPLYLCKDSQPSPL